MNPSHLSSPGSTNNVTIVGTNSFVVESPQNLYCLWSADITPALDEAITQWIAIATSEDYYDFNTNAYAVYATFAEYTPPGSSNTIRNYSCVVRMAMSNRRLTISPIDRSDTHWTTQTDVINGRMLTGTFTLPVTFSTYTPMTVISGVNDWC
jgi:hypothetical protein